MNIIECEKLTKKYKNITALDNMSLLIKDEGCIGFLGSNGAGKTTTMRILTGITKPTSGNVRVFNCDINKELMEIKKKIGYCPQHPTFLKYMTGKEWMYFVGSIFKMEKNLIKTKTEEILKDCGIFEERNRKISGYSGGMKQRLGIAQAIINNPKLLILDEPISSLDPKGRYEVLKLIEKIKKETTVFMSTHILDDIERIADKIIIIKKGKIILSETILEMRRNYIEPIIEFKLSENDKDISQSIIKERYVTKVRKKGNFYKVYCNDINVAKKKIPKKIISEGVTLMMYGISKASLEDIFLKVVNNS